MSKAWYVKLAHYCQSSDLQSRALQWKNKTWQHIWMLLLSLSVTPVPTSIMQVTYYTFQNCKVCRENAIIRTNKAAQKQWHSWLDCNWILTFCQLHRVTSGQSNCPKQMHISKLLSCYTNPFSHQIHKVNPYTNMTRWNELARGPGRKVREDIGKRNQMWALRFQIGGGHHTSIHSQPPLGGSDTRNRKLMESVC